MKAKQCYIVPIVISMLFGPVTRAYSQELVNIAPQYGIPAADATWPERPLQNAIDGDYVSHWSAGDFGTLSNPHWFQLDLQQDWQVAEITVNMQLWTNSIYRGYTNDYNLYVSGDGNVWTLIGSGTIAEDTDPALYSDTFAISIQPIRYVKYEVVGGTHWADLGELEVKVVMPSDTVEITGSSNAVLYDPISESPAITLSARVNTLGGVFLWEIVEGMDKINFVGVPSGESVVMKGISPSMSPEDVVIKVTYVRDAHISEDTHRITVQAPISLFKEFATINRIYNRLGRLAQYNTFFFFHVMDQFDSPILLDGMPWDEERQIVCRYRHVNKLDSGGGLTMEGGFIEDKVGTGDEFHGMRGIPTDFFMTVQQKIYVGNLHVGDRCQVYYYDYADSIEGICGRCP